MIIIRGHISRPSYKNESKTVLLRITDANSVSFVWGIRVRVRVRVGVRVRVSVRVGVRVRVGVSRGRVVSA